MIWKGIEGSLPAIVNITSSHSIREVERSDVIDFYDFYTASEIVDRSRNLQRKKFTQFFCLLSL